ncbi:MAG: ACT domain-containing protein [Planctomycetes bacterium]|nr:ACT domain-containing protein [Planctomycetota bacterium]
MNPFHFCVHPELLAIARLERSAAFPEWARGGFVNLACTSDELSVVCSQVYVPPEVRHERDRVALGIAGVVEMTSIGVLAALCAALARAQVSVFVISTYDTDWLIVRAEQFAAAKAALEAEGHQVDGSLPRT